MADAQEFLKDFPLLKMKMNGKQIAYLDNGATTQKPEQIIKAICGYYGGCNANPHRGAYALSVKATEIYENARARTAKFINAARPEENHLHQECDGGAEPRRLQLRPAQCQSRR